MIVYRRSWWCVAAIVWLVASTIAVMTVPVSALVVIPAFVGVCVAAGLAAASVENESIRTASRHAVLGAAAAVAGLGLMSSLGGFGLLMLTLLIATSPPLVEHWYDEHRQRLLQRRSIAAAEGEYRPEQPSTRSVSDLSTPDLILAWRTSFNALQRARTTSATSVVADRRRQYLDELERRDPEGLQRWLASDARPAGDPTRFLSGGESSAA